MHDPALVATPKAACGSPPKWIFTIRGDRKRGTGFNAPSRLPVEMRHVVTLFSITDVDTYQQRLVYSIKDFARGADRNQQGFVSGRPFFTARSDDIAAADVNNACKSDGAAYRLMVRWYDGETLITKGFIRTFMDLVERAIGVRLLWFAAIHSKATAAHATHKHVHILIRSRTIGDEVIRFTRPFHLYGFRWIASQLATKILGPRTAAEIAEADRRSKEIARNRTEQELIEAGAPPWAIARVLERME